MKANDYSVNSTFSKLPLQPFSHTLGTIPCYQLAQAPFDDIAIDYGFFGTKGGVGQHIHGELNMAYSSEEPKEIVKENRTILARSFGKPLSALYTVNQRHTPDVATITEKSNPDTPIVADALVTGVPGKILGVLTADCAPVLFYDADAKIIGASHAGWRGALAGILQATVKSMETLGAKKNHIHAILGPCIHGISYQVGPEFRDSFLENDPQHDRFFAKEAEGDSYLFDLPAFAMAQLTDLNLASLSHIAIDTYQNDQTLYSFRRACHQKQRDYGRQISAIMLK